MITTYKNAVYTDVESGAFDEEIVIGFRDEHDNAHHFIIPQELAEQLWDDLEDLVLLDD